VTVRVLVADDHEPFRRAVRSVLATAHDFELVGEAVSGEEAVDLADALRPDLILMDISMAGMGGIEAARRVTTAHPATVLILVSTYREEDIPAEAQACGAAAYLHKSELGGRALRGIWAALGPTPARRDRGSRPSPAGGSPSPRPDRA
jgi:two-component system, NarL family, invasion response regulator UvrY